MTAAADTRAERPASGDAAAGDRSYEVTAIRYGSLRAPKSALFYRYGQYGEADETVEMAYYFWLLRNRERTVLLDTGFHPAAAAKRGRECLLAPLEALAQVGVEPGAVSTVLISHLHYDHVGNVAAFGEAEIVAPRRELEFWDGPLATRRQFAEHVERGEIETVLGAGEEGRLRVTEGEEEVLPGIRAIPVGGHSPGLQVTTVETGGGLAILTSDAVHFYEELELDRPFGVIADLGEMYLAYDRLREMARAPGAMLVAGHDPAVAERFGAAADQVAVRIAAGETEKEEG